MCLCRTSWKGSHFSVSDIDHDGKTKMREDTREDTGVVECVCVIPPGKGAIFPSVILTIAII